MLRSVGAAVVALAWVASATAAGRRPSTEGLVQVVAPPARGEAVAHPHVNVILRFGTTEDGVAADPSTFRVRLGGTDISQEFTDVVQNGLVVGKRARIDKERLRIGRGRTNRIRCSVFAKGSGPRARGRPVRDVDRIRFRVVEGPNAPPTPKLAEGPRTFRPGAPITLDGSKSFDPDGDPVTISWEFGDGATAEGEVVAHAYEGFVDRLVRMIVRDGGVTPSGAPSESVLETLLVAEPVLPEGMAPGTAFVDSETGLEFGVVPPGTVGERTITIQNLEETEGHLVLARIVSDNPAFVTEPTTVTLAPGARASVTVRFAPTTEGHQQATLAIILAAANRRLLRVLAHGYAGNAAGTGPTLAAVPAFYTEYSRTVLGMTLVGIAPDGTRFAVDNNVYSCQAPPGTFASGDACLSDTDCAANGGTCQRNGICYGGARDRQPCTAAAECPGGLCSAAQLFESVDLCNDGAGGLYLLSDEGTFTDPNPDPDNELSATLLRIDVDPGRNTTGKRVLQRIASDTTKIACDGFRPEDGGRVYVAEYRSDPDPPVRCVRTDRELLVAVNKRTGGRQTVMPRIDAATGLRDCEDDFDPVTHLEAARERLGSSQPPVFAAFDSRGLWRIFPVARQFLLPEHYVPGQPTVFPHEQFRVHPDGSLVLVATSGGTTGGVVNVYRLTEAQVTGNPVQLSSLVPCGAISLPTNAIPEETQGFTSILGLAVGRSSTGGRDATALVSVATTSQRLADALGSRLQTRATVAFNLPADTAACTPLGPVALELFEQLTF